MAALAQNLKVKDEEKSNEPLDKAMEAGAQAVEKAKEAVASVGEMAGQAVSAVGKKADDMTSSAGADIKQWGQNLSESSPHAGVMGQASQAVATTLKEGGHYLEDAKLSGMADDVIKLIKQNPLPAVAIGFGIGFLLGRVCRS